MSDALFLRFRNSIQEHLPEAQANCASAMATIADAHADAMHLPGDFARGLNYAWQMLACECPNSTEEHREARLNYEVDFSVEALDIGGQWLPIIRERLISGLPSGRLTGTIAPNDDDFVREWLKAHESKERKTELVRSEAWTHEILFDAITMRRDFETSFSMVKALLASHTDEWQLVSLGSGPLEDMLVHFGSKAVDAFVPMLTTDPAFAKAIACTWISEAEIRAYWRRRITEYGVPVAIPESKLGPLHLPGPHAPL